MNFPNPSIDSRLGFFWVLVLGCAYKLFPILNVALARRLYFFQFREMMKNCCFFRISLCSTSLNSWSTGEIDVPLISYFVRLRRYTLPLIVLYKKDALGTSLSAAVPHFKLFDTMYSQLCFILAFLIGINPQFYLIFVFSME